MWAFVSTTLLNYIVISINSQNAFVFTAFLKHLKQYLARGKANSF